MTAALVVLGAAVWPGGEPSPTLQRRCNAAIDHWHTGAYDCRVPSGGLGQHGPAEAVVMARLFHKAGIDPDKILLEDRATTTFETAREVRALFNATPNATFYIITDRYHLLRARLAFTAFRLSSVGLSASAYAPPSRSGQMLWQWLRELPGTAYYALKLVAQRVRG